jgi:UDP-glucose 4-epimerase
MAYSLVTGGAGFLGAHVTKYLLQTSNQIIVLDDLSGGFKENIPSGVIFIEGSINDHKLLEELFNEYKIEFVYHLAAYAAEGLSHFIKRFNYTNNLIGSVNLINEAIKHKVKCFVFTSSIAVYGALEPPMREDMRPEPEDPYGIAKLAVELELEVSRKMFDLNYVIFRPHNVYGEFQNLGDRYRNVVGIFMNLLMQNKPLTVFGDGSQTRAFTYAGDIAPIIANCVHDERCFGHVYNLGADEYYSVATLAREVMKAMRIEAELRKLDQRNEVHHAHADHSKIKAIFGEYSKTSLTDGLRLMAQWAKSTGIKSSGKFEAIEITDKLPPIWLED